MNADGKIFVNHPLFSYSRSAFTMIELIFIIVILGILAAIAMPRLSATRDDAKAAATAHSVMTGIQEIASYAVSQGDTNSSTIAQMSNSFVMLQNQGDAVLSSIPINKAVVRAGNISNCLTVEINATTTDDILEMTFGNAGSDGICLSVQKLINVENYPIKLRGAYVKQ